MVVGGTLAGTLGGFEVAPPKAVAEWGSGDGGLFAGVELVGMGNGNGVAGGRVKGKGTWGLSMVVGGTMFGARGGLGFALSNAVAEWGSGDGGVPGRVEGRGKGGLSIEDAGAVLIEGLTGGCSVDKTGASNICGALSCVFAFGA